MQLEIIAVGKTKVSYWVQAETNYIKRIKRYVDLSQQFTKEFKIGLVKNDELVKQKEADELNKKLSSGGFIIMLDRKGKQLSSKELADFFQIKTLHGVTRFTFVVGGPLGFASGLLQKADLLLSLSRMTFPHEMAKVVLLEQIYRALTIVKGEKYHK